MSEIIATLHPQMPFQIREDGRIARQDVWEGEPAKLLGFALSPDVGKIDVTFEAWKAGLANGTDQAVGLYPVYQDDNDEIWTDLRPVSLVTKES